ncbi:MAG: acyltransferase [Chitinophagales bacterium]|nr:acyltransferase [Chitinophagales bacterium]
MPGALQLKQFFSKAFNLVVLEKSRMPWVDYLRGIAIVLVVYRHVLIGIERTGRSIPVLLEQANMIFFSFRMPLFFILSGLFISSSIAKRTIKKLVAIKFENLLYPYLIWAFLQTTLQIVLSNYTNAERTLEDYTYIFYQPRGLDQFWYLPALFNTTVIYILVKTKLRFHNWMQLLLGVALYFTGTYLRRVSMMSDWMEFYIFFAIGDSLSGLFFKQRAQRFLNSSLTLLLIVPIFAFTQYYYVKNFDVITHVEFLTISLIGCVSMFVFAFRLQKLHILSFLRVLGFHSLYIYVMHVIVSAFVRLVLTKFMGVTDPAILLFSGIATGVIIPVMLYNLIIKKKLWFLFTYHRPKATQAGEVQ